MSPLPFGADQETVMLGRAVLGASADTVGAVRLSGTPAGMTIAE